MLQWLSTNFSPAKTRKCRSIDYIRELGIFSEIRLLPEGEGLLYVMLE